MSNSSFISISERAYRYIRQFTIKTIEDGLVELITNCTDAYQKTSYISRPIEIEFNGNIIKVRDRALGLTSEGLTKCFLQVGEYTNNTSSRGFFSRGAKDITALGDVTFSTIKNNTFSQCTLSNQAYGELLISDIDATSDLREKYKIPEPFNGLEVEIKLLDNFINYDINKIYDSLCKLGTLRDIVADDANVIYLTDITKNFTKRIQYVYPESESLLNIKYNVPQYDGYIAEYVVYKAKKMIDQPSREAEMEFGFLIKDDTTVYEVNTIDDRFRWDPYMPYIFGYLKCNGIKELLHDYDQNGPSEKNPSPIIDPSRLTGVNKQHPFIIALLSIPQVRLDYILRQLNTSVSSKSISISEMGDLMDELGKYGLNLLEKDEIKMKFVPNYESQLVKAIEDDRLNFITAETNYLLSENSIAELESDKFIQNEIIKIQPENTENYIYVMNSNNQLIQIPLPSDNANMNQETLLKLINKDDALEKRPYVYKITSSGQLMKLYIFQKGKIEAITDPENEYILVKNKQFNIVFINDINIKQRYIIDNSQGITIKLNIQDPMVHKYLVSRDLNKIDSELSITNLSSTQSLLFLKELIIDIFSDIIVESDVMNNKIILDSNNYNNIKKLLVLRNKITSQIQHPIDIMFDKFIGNNIIKKKENIAGLISNIGTAVSSKINLEMEGGDILLLKSLLESSLDKLIE